MEWLQKCDDFFVDQRIFSDDTKVRQATFVLTGQAYHWNLNLRRLVTHKIAWNRPLSCVSCFRSGTGNGIVRNRSESTWNRDSVYETFGTVMEACDSELEASMDIWPEAF
ncbi:hypothetical protein Rs2_21696 [Raphanus sativus]|nr:hypothetical protein Rs2_21696 [Raphanus sativus]